MNSWIKIHTVKKKVCCSFKKWVNILFGPDASFGITCTVKSQHSINTVWIPVSALSRANPASCASNKLEERNWNMGPCRLGKHIGQPCSVAGSVKERQQQEKGVCSLLWGKLMVYTRQTISPPLPQRENNHRRCILVVHTPPQASGLE